MQRPPPEINTYLESEYNPHWNFPLRISPSD